MQHLVTLSGIHKTYNGEATQAALSGVSLGIGAGEFAAIMGPSGSGKSTLLNLIAGLDRPTQGTVVVDGQDIHHLGEAALARYRRDRVGFVFQFFHLLNNLSVLDNVALPAQLAGKRTREAQERSRTLLARLGIAEKADAFPARLSGGQRQRVAIARALINQPVLLLADEPTGALDSRSGEEVMGLLHDLNQDFGQTIVLVTHDARLAARYARRQITVRDGAIVDDVRLGQRSAQQAPAPLPAQIVEVGR
jgi:putative ABC transport system ATP-binding protein